MAHRFKLSAELDKRIGELASDLADFVEDQQIEWINRSDRWRESDAGVAVDGWIDDLNSLVDALESALDEPES